MGRGAYEMTDPSAPKSSAAGDAIRMHMLERSVEEATAAERKAEEDLAKLLRSKQSRGIVAARNAAKEASMKKTKNLSETEPEGDSQTTDAAEQS